MKFKLETEYYGNYDRQDSAKVAADAAFIDNYYTSMGFSITVEDVFTITGR